jgi:hypothetical protein
MARTKTRTSRTPRKALPAAAKLRAFTDSARTTIEKGLASTREAVGGLEKIFEQRVSVAIARLGVPTSRELRELSRQVAELESRVAGLKRPRA